LEFGIHTPEQGVVFSLLGEIDGAKPEIEGALIIDARTEGTGDELATQADP